VQVTTDIFVDGIAKKRIWAAAVSRDLAVAPGTPLNKSAK
jgi:hypothetical protein